MKKLLLILSIAFICNIQQPVSAQCSMCKATVESNLKSNQQSFGKGLNKGILYLMAFPYIFGGIAFGIYYKNRKKSAA